MNHHRLFNVLVLGGLAVLTSTASEDVVFQDEVLIEEAQPVFCDVKQHCIPDHDGVLQPKPGFVCCWGTSCE